MNELFLKIVNMSIATSWLILAVLILRFAFKKAPKWVNMLLWGIVAVRLICPFSIESALSLIPSAQTVPLDIEMDWTPAIDSGISSINSVINPVISASFTPNPMSSANPLQIWIPLAWFLWIFGMVAMLLYTAISYWCLRRKLHTAVRYKDDIFQSENVSTPFVFGILRPRIYLPLEMDGQELEYVIAHEQAHIRRKDHWWKPLGFLLLTIHWFNPLLWLAYVLLCRDIELACDEKVIKDLGCEQRADYTQALLDRSVGRRIIGACPLAFGEVSVKERVKSVMRYKKPTFWVVILAVVACVAVAVCFLTDPPAELEHTKSENDTDYVPAVEKEQVREELQFPESTSDRELMIDPVAPVSVKNLMTGEQRAVSSMADIRTITEVLCLDKWIDGITPCEQDFEITINGEVYKYHSECGTFSGNKRSLLLDDEQKAEINRIITEEAQPELSAVLDDGTVIHYPAHKDLYEPTPVEQIEEKYDKEEFVISKLHYKNIDSEWVCGEYTYQYRLEIFGRMHNAAKNTTYIVLSNRLDITFDQTWKASGLSSNMADYFDPAEAIIVGHKLSSL